MTPGRRESLRLALVAAITGPAGFFLTTWLDARDPPVADVSADAPATGTPSMVVAGSRGPSVASAAVPDRPGPPRAVPIRLPPFGSFDQLAMENQRLRGVRSEVQRHLGYQDGIACSGIEVADETRIRVTAPVRMAAGKLTLSQITRIEVARGAQPPTELVTCIQGLVPAPVSLPGPTADGTWPRMPDAEGDVIIVLTHKPRQPPAR
jgi:hypothetical protein